jgi:hypothetical protein
MIDAMTVRAMARELPETSDGSSDQRLVFSVGGKGYAWSFMERVTPKKPRAPRLDILAVRCLMERKEMLIEAAPDRYFDDDHYRGFPAVLVRLEAVEEAELRALLAGAWRLLAPKTLLRRLDAEGG